METNKYTMLKLYTDLCFAQGSPLSSIQHLFYNTDFLNNCNKKNFNAQGYINDITFMYVNKSIKDNIEKLR